VKSLYMLGKTTERFESFFQNIHHANRIAYVMNVCFDSTPDKLTDWGANRNQGGQSK